ncbi:Histidine triad nucleotide-binding protein 3 [Dionaea muscipula]
MEAPRRRLAALCSHLRPIASTDASSPSPHTSSRFANLSASTCSSNSSHHQNRARDSLENDDPVKECVFCRIICGEGPAYKVYEDDLCLCILDTSPLCRGHSLLIPKVHFSSLDATPPPVIAAMCSKIPFITNAIKKATGCDSFNLLVNNGAAAGQVIFHTHIHLIPRKARDCLWASESLRRLSLQLDKDASQLAECIRGHLSFSNDAQETGSQGTSFAGNYRE